jgi:hypothetical protein
MLASILIILISFVLLVYWFRYSCILLLRGHAKRPSAAISGDNFNFRTVRERIGVELDLDPLHRALQRDYKVMTFLLENAAGLELSSFEDKLLLWDYRAMQLWYWVTKTAAPQQARQALSEMASVLSVLGSKIHERAGASLGA